MSLNQVWNNQPYPRFTLAPMLDVTDRHWRFFMRLLSRNTLLYTEMVTTGALLHSHNPQRFLDFSAAEGPVALQLGGSDPVELAKCTVLATQWGYNEVNLNVGCPSDRVQNNKIGACLMAEPQLVAECLQAMQDATHLPVTIKCRIGIDNQDEDADLTNFISLVKASGVKIFIVHARKAWLQGLSPKQNREIPPLNYARVERLKAQHPDLCIALNGGITSLEDSKQHLHQLDSVMLGRAVWQHPWLVAQADEQIYGAQPNSLTQQQAVLNYLPYVAERLQAGTRLNPLMRPLLNLFQGVPGARKFRRILSEGAHLPGAGVELIETALAQVTDVA